MENNINVANVYKRPVVRVNKNSLMGAGLHGLNGLN